MARYPANNAMLAQLIHLIPYGIRNKIKDLPLVGPLQRRIFQAAFRGEMDFKMKEGPAKGLVFPLKLPEDKLFWTGLWEKEFSERLATATRPGTVCLDVGAYRGYFSGLMGVNGAGVVHCFEPNPENIAKLEKLKKLNPGLPLRIHPLALGDRDGETEFVLMAEDTMGKLAKSSFQHERESGARFPVRLARLDTLVERGEVPLPDLVKVDVEGAERMFLEGAMTSLRAKRPTVLLEYHSGPLARECAAILEGLGYQIEWLETDRPEALGEEAVGHLVASPKDRK
jgi:FkbM family methyltransferase